MRQYLDLLAAIRDTGARKGDRTGTGALSLFGRQMRFDLAEAFRSSPPRSCTSSRSSMSCSGSCEATPMSRYLKEHGVTHLGRMGRRATASSARSTASNGAPGRRPTAGRIDQIAEVVERSERNPDSRRHIVSAWNPAELDEMALPPCHCLFQFYVGGRHGSPASSTSALPTCSSACRSTSPPMRCSP